MEDTSFLYFTQDDIIKKIDIDPRLVDSFKRVMVKLQDYFNANGYTSQRDYKEYIEKYLLNSGNKNMRFYIDKIERKNVGGFYAGGVKFNGERNEICINEEILKRNPEVLDSTLCHEFIHFLVMHGLEKGKAEEDIIYGGFINESLTEMLTQQMYPNSNAYDAQVAMQKYANLVSGKSNNFSRFLQGYIDARYSSPAWENYRSYTNAFQSEFSKKGYINLREAQSNSNFVNAQRKLISLFVKPTENKNINEYIDAINKLLDRPVADTDYINNEVVATMDRTLIASLRLNDKSLNDFLQKKLAELRDVIVASRKDKGKKLYEFEFEGRRITIDDNLRVSGDIIGIQRQFNPNTGEMVFMLNGKKMSININNIDFNERENRINSQIESLSSYFKKESSQDLSMISQAAKQQGNLTKIEKFTLPNVDGKDIVVYVANYGDKVVILGKSTQIGNIENIEQSRYIGVTSKNPRIAAINYESLGNIDKGLLFSVLTSKQIQNNSIYEYCKQLETKLTLEEINRAIEDYKNSSDFVEESEEEIRYEAIRRVALSNFDKLSEKEKKEIISQVYKQNPRLVFSTKDGKIDVSIMFGDKNSFKGHSEVLYDSKGLGMYNEVFDSISKSIVSDLESDKSSILLDEDGNIVYSKEKESETVQNNPQEELIKLNEQMKNLRIQYGTITAQMENLMKQNQQNPVLNYQQQLDALIKQRDSISEQMELISSSQGTYQSIIQHEKENNLSNRIAQVEKLLGIRITDTAMYEYDPNLKAPRTVLKDKGILSEERGSINKRLDELYHNNQLDVKTYNSMKLAVYQIYEQMSKKAPKPNLTSSTDPEFTQKEELTPYSSKKDEISVHHSEKKDRDDLEFEREQMRKKYHYNDMTDSEKHRLDEQIEDAIKKRKGKSNKVDPKEELEEQRKELRRKQFQERARTMGLDIEQIANLDNLFAEQQIIEQMKRESEQMEEVEDHGMHM